MKLNIRGVFSLLLALFILCIVSAIAEEEINRDLPFPSGNLEPEDFSVALDGSLMVHKKDGNYILMDNKWVKSHLSAQTSSYTVEHQANNDWVIKKEGTPIFSDNGDLFFNTLCPADDQTAYATMDNKVYRLDLTTGIRKLVCNILGFDAADWANGLLISDQTLYVMQTQIPMLQAIDLQAVSALGIQYVTIAMASKMDIGNAVLDSTEQHFAERYPKTVVEIVKVPSDQCRLNLMADPSAYDLIVAQPDVWDDLAQAGIFENLEAHPSLREAWLNWIDMGSLCRYDGVLYGVLLWDNADVLWVNEALLPILSDVIWPDPDWTWTDFLTLARQCCRDLNGDGKPDLYIAYQRSIHAGWNTIYPYSLPVHQAALLYRHGKLSELQSPEILSMLSTWKTCWEEGLLCPEDANDESPHNSIVVFAEKMPPEWCQYKDIADIRFTLPGLTSTLRCVPAESALMSINTRSANTEQAVAFMELYMHYGADEHNYLKTHCYWPENGLIGNPAWKAPDAFHEAHYIATMGSLYRDDWDTSIYDDMEQQLLRYLQGQITAEECAHLWQQKLRMTQME